MLNSGSDPATGVRAQRSALLAEVRQGRLSVCYKTPRMSPCLAKLREKAASSSRLALSLKRIGTMGSENLYALLSLGLLLVLAPLSAFASEVWIYVTDSGGDRVEATPRPSPRLSSA